MNYDTIVATKGVYQMNHSKNKKHAIWGGTLFLGTALLCTQFILQKENQIKLALFENTVKETSKKVETWIAMYLEPQIDEIRQELCFSPSRNNKNIYSSITMDTEIRLPYEEPFLHNTMMTQKIMRKIKR